MPNFVSCPLCHADAKLINGAHPGYQRPQVFAIYGCQYCDLQFAWPMRTDAAIYEHIYRQAERMPGYDFYTGLAASTAHARSPLDWLASNGPGYWFIREAMRTKLPPRTVGARVVEIGSGLGYLTHALASVGYDITGIDISATAVADAAARFGDRYVCADVNDYATRYPSSVSAAVMVEVLEHLPDPVAMLTAIRSLLKPGGFALITTPNKSVYRASEYWQTDNPPVHLWWLSETSVRRLARDAGFDIALWDFTGFHRPATEQRHTPSQLPMKPPMLDESGDLIIGSGKTSATRRLKALRDSLFPALKRRKQERRRQAARLRWADEHGDAIGLVLTKPTE